MSEEFDINALLSALDNDNNEDLLQLDYKKITEIKTKILKGINLNKTLYNKLQKQLKEYRYIDEVPDLKYGNYIRWISLRNTEDIKLTNGGFISDIKIFDDGVHVVCRNSTGNLFQIRMYENIIFQKLTEQEKILLSALSYL